MYYVLIFLAFVVALTVFRAATSQDFMDYLGRTATDIIRPLVAPVVDLINAPAFVFIASALILVSAIIVCILFWARSTVPVSDELKLLNKSIDATFTADFMKETSANTMISRLEEIIFKTQPLVSPWSAFTTDLETSGRIPTKPFANYVAEDQEALRRERNALIRALPGYYVSFGLILTFLGLVVALHFASRGFRSGGIDEARAAIIQLLNASSFKFLTSVAALTGALIITVVARVASSKINSEKSMTVAKIERVLAACRSQASKTAPTNVEFQALIGKLDAIVSLLQSNQLRQGNTKAEDNIINR